MKKISREDKVLVNMGDGDKKKHRLVVVQKWRGEEWQDAVRRVLAQKLRLSDKEMCDALKPPIGDPSSFCGIVEETQNVGESYPMPKKMRTYFKK